MTTRLFKLAAGAGLTSMLLVGCSAPAPSPTPATTAVATVSATPTPCGSCDGKPQAEHTGPANITLTPEAQTAALAAAKEAMTAYTNTGLDRDAWWAGLAPLLTTGFAANAKYIQPSRLPVREFRAGPMPVEGQLNGYQVRATFETNAGSWTVIMTRTSATAPWLASNIAPSEEIGGN